MKRLHLLLGALAAFTSPEPAHAQLGAPIETLCTSYAQEYCVQILSYEAGSIPQREPRGFFGTFNATVHVYGSAVSKGLVTGFALETVAYGASLDGTPCFTGLYSSVQLDGPSTHDLNDASGGCAEGLTEVPENSTAGIWEIQFFTADHPDPRCARENIAMGPLRETQNECVSVPEPTTALLIATGMVGLVARRRSRPSPRSDTAA